MVPVTGVSCFTLDPDFLILGPVAGFGRLDRTELNLPELFRLAVAWSILTGGFLLRRQEVCRQCGKIHTQRQWAPGGEACQTHRKKTAAN